METTTDPAANNGNALAYTPAGGSVHVTIRADRGMALVEVTDTGAGLTLEQTSAVFERFYRADRRRPGGTGTTTDRPARRDRPDGPRPPRGDRPRGGPDRPPRGGPERPPRGGRPGRPGSSGGGPRPGFRRRPPGDDGPPES